MQLKTLLFAPALMAVTACVPAGPEPMPTPTRTTPAPIPTSAPLTMGTRDLDDWMDRAITPGDWTYAVDAGETLALFGTSRSAAATTLVLSCDRASRRVSIGRMGEAAGQREMRIRTETADRTLTASAVPAAGTARGPIIVAQLSANDPLLDAIAFSNGRFAVQVPGQTPVIAPAWPEITRVIEDCRN